MAENNYGPLIIHSRNASLDSIKKRTGTSSSTEFLDMKNLGILDYIANSVNIITLNSIIQFV
jgi:hypothetical protein